MLHPDLISQIRDSARAHFGSGASAEAIAGAESTLGVKFPPSYRAWLASYGAGYLASYPLNGLYEVPTDVLLSEEVVSGHVVDETLRKRANGLPDHLIPLLSYEGDEVYFLDLSRSDSLGEAPVVVVYAGDIAAVHCADSFADFLLNEL